MPNLIQISNQISNLKSNLIFNERSVMLWKMVRDEIYFDLWLKIGA